jgi:hypothetical protein
LPTAYLLVVKVNSFSSFKPASGTLYGAFGKMLKTKSPEGLVKFSACAECEIEIEIKKVVKPARNLGIFFTYSMYQLR